MAAFAKLKDEIEKIVHKDELERNALSFFDYISWLQSKLEGVTYIEILQQRNTSRKAVEE